MASAGEKPDVPAGATVRLVVGLRGESAGASAVRAMASTGIRPRIRNALEALDARVVEVGAQEGAAAVAALRRDPNVEYVEVDALVRKAAIAPNDPGFAKQTELTRVGVPTAWETTTGSANVTVAVVDSGVTAIGDLAGAVTTGWDFVNGDSKPVDDEGHGTAVSSLIAARGNNGVGMAGVCWSCKIMPVKVLNAQLGGFNSDIAAGILYAVKHGAKIINLSLSDTERSTVLRKAVAYAVGKGALLVAAAGNNAASAPHYPAAYPGVLAVGGTDDARNRFVTTDPDGRLVGSNYGNWVDVAAPFCAIAMTHTATYEDFCGTSASTPLVAGVAALILAKHPRANGWSLRHALTSTTRALNGGWLANGLINAGSAVRATPDVTKPTITGATPAEDATARGTVTVTATGVADTGSGVDRVSLYANGDHVGVDTSAPYAVAYNSGSRNGRVRLQWRVYDRAGNVRLFDRDIVVDNTAPKVKITGGPKNKAKVARTVRLTVSARDARGIDRVELLVNGKVVATDARSRYAFSLKIAAYAKRGRTLTVRVRAYDTAGNVAYTKARTWTRK